MISEKNSYITNKHITKNTNIYMKRNKSFEFELIISPDLLLATSNNNCKFDYLIKKPI